MTKDYIGWLFPDGTFWNCGYGMHIAAADEICEFLNINIRDTERHLEVNGFVKITIVDGLYYVYSDFRTHFTFEQYRWIKEKIDADINNWHPLVYRIIDEGR